ncbi:MAG: isoprenylcysteine carboxylmethyltransferase family protein [Acidobacteria bacterium]|nr:isoprenylcysteine carboxylmethyltransferase family protein [Acidobacteriota bacterium]
MAFAQRFRVFAGFLLAVAFLVCSRPTPPRLWFGAALAAVGLGIRIWATGYLQKNSRLATGGPYALTRNPLYFGSLLLGLGFMLTTPGWWFPAIFLSLFVLFYLPTMRSEEKQLQELFGEAFEQYRCGTPLFFPALRLPGGHEPFDLSRVRANREYNAVLGYLAVFGLLILKTYFGAA